MTNGEAEVTGVLGAVAMVVGIFFAVPMVAESTTNSCLALERHVVGRAADLDDGRAAAQTAVKQFPQLPTAVSCAYMYWRVTT